MARRLLCKNKSSPRRRKPMTNTPTTPFNSFSFVLTCPIGFSLMFPSWLERLNDRCWMCLLIFDCQVWLVICGIFHRLWLFAWLLLFLCIILRGVCLTQHFVLWWVFLSCFSVQRSVWFLFLVHGFISYFLSPCMRMLLQHQDLWNARTSNWLGCSIDRLTLSIFITWILCTSYIVGPLDSLKPT
jgi:hypothetical protein